MTKNAPMKTLTVSLSPRQIERLQGAVRSGSYASSSEVVREALRLWEQREEVHAMEIARLKQAYDEAWRVGMDAKLPLKPCWPV